MVLVYVSKADTSVRAIDGSDRWEYTQRYTEYIGHRRTNSNSLSHYRLGAEFSWPLLSSVWLFCWGQGADKPLHRGLQYNCLL